MASLFILSLNIAVGAALAGSHLVPETCLQGPEFWCKDMATAVECRREQYCWNLQNGSLLWETLLEEEEAPAPGKKCSMCIKIMQKLQELAGDDPDEEAINNAIRKTCKSLPKPLGWVCKTVMKKFRDKIIEALQNNEDPKEMCVDLKICRRDSRVLPGPAAYAAAH
ncbi:antimicrobial peptide NK-lysin-like [Eublepharis macularius]|uniref:Antimicrobial peptide NK-lysin-like n=1 Tax=Eublepharis macularius TaxID=481883 RepID=A0AA97KEG0_EUBMA|nr:antimicrobial peptide NK-lysin-like [Eublepharis macularius]